MRCVVILPLVYYGNPVLRQVAQPVTMMTEEICTLIRDLEDTLNAHEGYGIAAPQVGVPLAICLSRYPLDPDAKHDTRTPTRVFLNPQISLPSDASWEVEEDCLSIPGLMVKVTRPVSITVTALGYCLNPFTEELSGWAARVLLHECDHLQGKLITDYSTSKERLSAR